MTTMTRERPILFSTPLIPRLLDGSKTQTRRLLKPQPIRGKVVNREGWHWDPTRYNHHIWHDEEDQNTGDWAKWFLGMCPYGRVGDVLWVREAWCGEVHPATSKLIYNDDGNTYRVLYRADGHEVYKDDGDGFVEFNKDGTAASPWRPSIHMPRWASRIDLEITEVRVERVNQISHRDALAEGVDYDVSKEGGAPVPSFARQWDQLHGPGAFERGDWCWVLSFRRIKP